MRRPSTFLVTLLSHETDPSDLRGRIRYVATGEEISFIDAQELIAYLRATIPRRTEGEGTPHPGKREDP